MRGGSVRAAEKGSVQAAASRRAVGPSDADWLWHTTEAAEGNVAFTDLYAGSWVALESPVEAFRSAPDARGILHPETLKSIGVQFFTWGGPWSGKVYLDQAELVDSLPETTVLRRAGRGNVPARFGAGARRYDARGRRMDHHFDMSGN